MKLLSKLPQVIHSAFTQYSGEIRVVDFGPIRRLLVGGLVQSVSLNEENLETKVWSLMVQPPFELPANSKILMLGLGGGTTAHILNKKYQPSLIRVVEIDPQIIKIARNYFDLGIIPNLDVVNVDAFEYLDNICPAPVILSEAKDLVQRSWLDSSPSTPLRIRMTRDKFDYVIVDLYAGKDFPKEGSEINFYQNIKKVLAKNGGCVVNRIFAEDEKDLRVAYFDLLKRVFPEAHEQVIPGTTHFKNYLYFSQITKGPVVV